MGFTRIRDHLRPRRREGWDRSDRVTAGLAALALAGAGTALAGQYTRLLRRRTHERPGSDGLIESANAAALDTVGVAVEGYATAPRSETVLFNILAGFLGSFATVRLSTWAIRDGRGPFRNVRVGGRHIHHFIPGILIAFGAGTTALLTDDDRLEDRLALPMGVGMGLTFDEAALLLDLRDVYWSEEGMLSVQVSLGLTAILSTAILTLRILRRGERRQEEAGEIPPAYPLAPPLPIT
jgi:hypothetical protein